MADQIVSRLQSAFENALETENVLFFPSTLHLHQDSGLQFELRLCPALELKPKLPAPHFERTQSHDPFAPPYSPQLLVGELDGDDTDYVVLLNKYAVIPRHFLLVTKEFRSQSSPLLPSDLLQIYLLLSAARRAGDNFLAFFNCGNLSGASQHHKHIQFIPVEEGSPPIESLAKAQKIEVPATPFSLNTVPYTNFVFRLPLSLSSYPPESIAETLSQAFVQLIDLVIGTLRKYPERRQGPPSFNVLVTLDHIHVIPRSKESYDLNGNKGSLSVNALGFAGMLLVKNVEEMEAVKQEGLANILRGVGLQNLDEEIDEDLA